MLSLALRGDTETVVRTWSSKPPPAAAQTLRCQSPAHGKDSSSAQTQGEGGHPRVGDGNLRGKDALCSRAGEANQPGLGEGLQRPPVLQVPPAQRNAAVQGETVLHLQQQDQRARRSSSINSEYFR